ncbi:phosphoglycerate mutase [Alternaria alternata]|nr:phosphoglycerate mutase [Alternaria alternata]
MASKSATCQFQLQAVSGFFIDFVEKARHDTSFRATTLPGLGLIDRTYETDVDKNSNDDQKLWKRFRDYVDYLNDQSAASTTYKVLYLTRHGLGFHNSFESEVGRDAWNSHWSHLDGDGKVIWADSQLNAVGIKQAEELGRFWSDAVSNEGIPLPGTLYTSPLARCLNTTRLAFARTFEEQGVQFRPIVKESLRELITDHTCDRRSTRSWIEENYPDYLIEPNFSEKDSLWTGGHWETRDEHTARKQAVLEDIFSTDENAFIGLTVHSYAISAILRAVGLPEFRVREGSSIALLVKGEKIDRNN